jgi:endonuclease/exonuclease/phosphatase family metal-dependent hydrolase
MTSYECKVIPVITTPKIFSAKTAVRIESNRTLIFFNFSGGENKRTGQIVEVSIDEKSDNLLTVLYEKKVRKIGDVPKQIRLKFESSQDLDYFMAYYTSSLSLSSSIRSIPLHNDKGVITIWVGTFNMGNKAPKEDFVNYLLEGTSSKPTIMFYSAQEADYGSGSVEQLFDVLTNTIQAQGYVCIVKRAFWEMRLVVFVRKQFEPLISNVMASTEATGIMNLMGNKGGLITCFNILSSPIAIVSSHLNAHQGHVERRNEDFRSICTVDNIGTPPFDLCSGFHHVIWAGDLNYRIEMTFQEVVDATAKEDWDGMWPYDQLNQQMQLGRTFNGFQEGKIEFAPTYKFKKGTCTYDAESKRIPAWCDRVLIRSFDGLDKKCLEYKHHSNVLTSDHHPVSALWELEIVMPPPSPPPFASIIGVRPYVEISNLQIDIGQQINSVCVEFVWPFSERSDELKTATGRGKKFVAFPDDTVPLLVPESFVSAQYLKTTYIQILITVNERIAIAILPLFFANVDVFRPFSLKAEYKLEEIGKVTGSMRLVSASEAHIREQQLRHQKAQPTHFFQTM